MYNKELETSAVKHAEHIKNLKAQASERLAKVAALLKLKRLSKAK